MKKTIKIVGDILFYLLIAFFLFVSVKVIYAEKNNETPEVFGYKFFGVLTGSMEPEIKPGDLVIIKETDGDKIQKGDIITFQTSDKNNLVTHRVIDIKNDDGLSFQTQGDANNTPDSSLTNVNLVEGRFVKTISGGGYFVQNIKDRIFIILGVIIAVIAVIGIIVKLCKKPKAE